MSNSLSRHHQQFFNQTCERIYFRDKDRKLTWANQSFVGDTTSDDASQLMGTTLSEIEVEAVIAEILGEFEEAVYEKHESQTRSNLRGLIGSTNVSISVECHPVHSEDGAFEGIIGQYRVVEVSHQLDYGRTMLDSLMKHSQDLIYFKDRDSKFTRVSESVKQRLGVNDTEDLVGKSDFDFWDKESAQGFFEDEQEVIATGEPLAQRCSEKLRSDGESLWVITSKMPVFDEDNQVIGTLGISKDLTELKQTERLLGETHQQLVAASREAGMAEIATNVIHNVGNVLNSINISIAMGRDLVQNQNAANLLKAAELLAENVDNSEYLISDPKGKALPGFIKLSAETMGTTQEKLLDEFENLRKHLEHVKTVISLPSVLQRTLKQKLRNTKFCRYLLT